MKPILTLIRHLIACSAAVDVLVIRGSAVGYRKQNTRRTH
jgi:hypothetical protein